MTELLQTSYLQIYVYFVTCSRLRTDIDMLMIVKNEKFHDHLPGILALYNHSARQQFYNPAFKLFKHHCSNIFFWKRKEAQ